MNPENIFNSKNIKTIVFITIIVLIIGLVISAIATPKYKSSAKLLVIFSQSDMNPYTSAQTSNYIAGILEEVIYSDSFVDNVYSTNFELENDLGTSQEEKMKNWRKMVKTNLQENKGIINIDVYHQDSQQANDLAHTIGYVLITSHSQYHGSGANVAVKMISAPTVSEKWAEPNIAQNVLLSLVAGLFIGLTFVIVFPEQELVNFIFGKKMISRDETINFDHNAGFDSESDESDNGYNNWQ